MTESVRKHATRDSCVSHGPGDASDTRQESWARCSSSVCSLLFISGGSLSSWHLVRISWTQKLTAGGVHGLGAVPRLQSQWCDSCIPSIQCWNALTTSDPGSWDVGVVDCFFFLLELLYFKAEASSASSLPFSPTAPLTFSSDLCSHGYSHLICSSSFSDLLEPNFVPAACSPLAVSIFHPFFGLFLDSHFRSAIYLFLSLFSYLPPHILHRSAEHLHEYKCPFSITEH